MPFLFEWCCNDDNLCGNSENSPNGYLQLGTPGDVTPTHITIRNDLTDETITINPINGVTEASLQNYHYKLAFNSGTLAEPTSIHVESGNWSISVDDDEDHLYLLWTGLAQTLNPQGTLEVILEGLAADSEVTKRSSTTEVTVSWDLDNFEIKQTSRPAPSPYTDNITLELKMVKTTGQSNIPLYVGFVGCNKVLNTDDEESSLQLRVTNTNFNDDENFNVTFHYDNNPSNCSQLVVILEVGDSTSVPWALATEDQLNSIGISIEDGWEDAVREDIQNVDDIVTAIQWTFTPKDDVVLHAQKTLLINLSNIVTAHPTGETNLYLRYSNVPDYQDGQFICQIEKAPLVFDDKVRIGTEIQDIAQFIFRSDVGNNGDLSSAQFFKQDEETTPLMELKADGNLELNLGDLNFYSRNGQRINLYGSQYGIGIQYCTCYFRTGSNFAWHKDGSHNDEKLNPGEGGTVQMVLYNEGDLEVKEGRIKDKTGFVIPVGTIVPYAGSTAPTGWFLCNGRSFSSSNYPELYKVLGNTDCTPDLQGRFIVGVGTKDGYSYNLNEKGGEEKHKLEIKEMPNHDHVPEPEEYKEEHPIFNQLLDKATGIYTTDGSTDSTNDQINISWSQTIKAEGEDEPHENRPPYYALNYIIKA